MLEYLPLVAAGLLVVVIACVPLSEGLSRVVTWTAVSIFGDYARSRAAGNRRQARRLRAAHIPQPYVMYASRTFLYTAAAAVIGGVLGLYLVVALLALLEMGVLPVSGSISDVGPLTLLGAVLAGSVTLGVVTAFVTYQFRWMLPQYRADERARHIDTTLERNIAFMFALSRSGMSFTEILRILAKNHHVYGEAAKEVGVTVRDVDLFGADLISALRRTANRTPSDDFQEFIENLTSVLQSGQSVSRFLRDEYEYYKEESESEQERFLELLSTLAEAYVTVFVAGPLFLITILVVIGLVLGGTLTFLRVFTYLVIPLATVGLVVYLDSITSDTDFDRARAIETGAGYERVIESHVPGEDGLAADGGTAGDVSLANRARLRAYKRIQPVRYALTHPAETILERPVWLLAITSPIAVLYVLVRWLRDLLAMGVTPAELVQPATLESLLSTLDDPVVQALLFVVGTFALVWEVRKRRVDAIERAVPDFLDRLASTNEAGMPIVASLKRVVRSDLGGLNTELDRTWADVQWGAPVEAALQRFERRIRTPTVTRIVTLTTNAMSATSDLGPVLRIAADEAKSTQRLKRERRNELVTYLVVIYLAFFVFLAIIVALDTIFVPAIPTAEQFGDVGATTVGGIGQITEAQKQAYSLLFFHTALVQSVCSGFVAGQMAEDDPRSGAKHAFIMLTIAYGIFLFFG
ncbi:type II secretion system F family protein [Halarchaeum sp. P4]|uniref:type II secretion system F family protein n=1 Tax=Halarchaeum sp. P4 TaxID=3421639 RepID=UPI003EB704F1